MARPATDTEERLIRAALAILPETGFSRLTLRGVAAKAKVNLGMFSYLFKNKREFIHKVMERMYEDFLDQFQISVDSGANSRERLANALLAMGRFVRDRRDLFAAMVRDVIEGDRDCIRFIENNFHRHIKTILKLVQQCRKDGYLDDTLPIPLLLGFCGGSVMAPVIVTGIAGRVRTNLFVAALFNRLKPHFIGDRALEARVELALKAVTTTAGKTPKDKAVVRKRRAAASPG